VNGAVSRAKKFEVNPLIPILFGVPAQPTTLAESISYAVSFLARRR
jgi:hypothetical protein